MIEAIKHMAVRGLLLLLALQMLNHSVDAIDFQYLTTSSALTTNFNDINSAAEYISEIVLGHKDAFPEYQKKSDSKQSQILKQHFASKIFKPRVDYSFSQTFVAILTFVYPLNEQYSFLFTSEINPPPPKA